VGASLSRRGLLKGMILGAAGIASARLDRGVALPATSDGPSLARRGFLPGVASDVGGGAKPSETSLLRSLADSKGFALGLNGGNVHPFPAMERLFLTNFNRLAITFHMTAPWVTNPAAAMRPSPTTYNFWWQDDQYQWALSKGVTIHGAALVWGPGTEFVPEWVFELGSRAAAAAALTDHVKTVVSRYPAVPVWEVANEPWHDQVYGGAAQPGGDIMNRRDPWWELLGEDYPIIAGRAARDANPKATLIINDDYNYYPTKTFDANYRLAQRMVSEGVLDGIGFQMHMDVRQPLHDSNDVRRAFEAFANLNKGRFSLHVTECDVNLHATPGSRQERWALQAQYYYEMFRLFIEAGGREFITFNESDDHSWFNNMPDPWGGPDAEATLFTPDLQPKPAYYALREALLRFQAS
jgi:GH35 family endo-1,4-beta-xylanase